MHWPYGVKEEDKIDMWQRVLAPNLGIMITEYKNKIHQLMRLAFNGKLFSDIFYAPATSCNSNEDF